MLVPDRVRVELELIQEILTDKDLKHHEKLNIITDIVYRILREEDY